MATPTTRQTVRSDMIMHLRCIRDVEDAVSYRNGQSTTYKFRAKRPTATLRYSLLIFHLNPLCTLHLIKHRTKKDCLAETRQSFVILFCSEGDYGVFSRSNLCGDKTRDECEGHTDENKSNCAVGGKLCDIGKLREMLDEGIDGNYHKQG